MPQYVPVRDFKALNDVLQVHEPNHPIIYIYFYGQKDNSGKSWCPDCIAAEEGIMSGFRNLSVPNALVLVVDVGDRTTWNQMNHPFRKPPFMLNGIPALLRWKGVERLEGDQLLNPELVEMFFEEVQLISAKPSATAVDTKPVPGKLSKLFKRK